MLERNFVVKLGTHGSQEMSVRWTPPASPYIAGSRVEVQEMSGGPWIDCRVWMDSHGGVIFAEKV
jgi:hypothetical protein